MNQQSTDALEEIVGILENGGYTTVIGADAVLDAISSESDGSTEKRCSGWRVFPDGTRCDGCEDCFSRKSRGG